MHVSVVSLIWNLFPFQVGSDLPPEIAKELEEQTARIKAMP